MTTQQENSVRFQLAGNSAAAYEQFLVPKLFAPWAAHMIQIAAFRSGEYVLDIGCGTGIVARTAADAVGRHGRIVGLDINQAMLDMAATTTNGTLPIIEWRHGNAHQLPFSDTSFDAVFCQQAIQFFDEPSQALQEMRRILTPTGRAVISVWRAIEHNPPYAILVDALDRQVSAQAAAIMRSPFPAWTADHLRTLLHSAGFNNVHLTVGIGSARFASVRAFLDEEVQSTPLAGPFSQVEADLFETLHDDLQAALAPYLDDSGLIVPMQTYVILAQRK